MPAAPRTPQQEALGWRGSVGGQPTHVLGAQFPAWKRSWAGGRVRREGKLRLDRRRDNGDLQVL